MPQRPPQALGAYIDKEIMIHHDDESATQGVLKGFDSNMNMYLVLASRIENQVECDGGPHSKPLGAVIILGSNVSAVYAKEGMEVLHMDDRN